MGKVCAVCGVDAVLKCESCGKVLYCSEDHRKSHTSSHKPECKVYRVEKNSKYGRYLVTNRDVQAGELLVRESPLLVGPRVDSPPACLECFIPLYPSVTRCPRCGVTPLCHQCSHNILDCSFFNSLSKDQKDLCIRANNQYILPLKVLLNLKKPDAEEKFKRFLEMEAHLEERRGSDVWCSHHQNVVKLLQSCGVVEADEEDVELLQRICGILDVNSFEVRGSMGLGLGMGMRLRGIYLDAALMAHDCVTNVHLSVDNNFVMTIRASVAIPRGQPMLYNYTDPLQTTVERQKHLKEGKYFKCECRRCEDPTELGTYLSAIWCPRCRSGRVLACQNSQHWICDNCDHRYSPGLVSTTVLVARHLLDCLDRSDPRQLEGALSRLSDTFVPSHSLLLDLKQSVVGVYRELEPTSLRVRRKVELCRELVPILRRIEPGISRLIGITLYELHIGLVSQAQEQSDAALLKEAEDILKESLSALLYEPTVSPEGELTRQAMQELKTLKTIIARQEQRENKKNKRGKHKK